MIEKKNIIEFGDLVKGYELRFENTFDGEHKLQTDVDLLWHEPDPPDPPDISGSEVIDSDFGPPPPETFDVIDQVIKEDPEFRVIRFPHEPPSAEEAHILLLNELRYWIFLVLIFSVLCIFYGFILAICQLSHA